MLHLKHHVRFYTALLIGVAVALIDVHASGPLRLIAGGDVFFAVHLALVIGLVIRMTPDLHRDRAAYPDEGVLVIFLIIAAVITVSLAAIFALLQAKEPPGYWGLAASIVSVPLGWVMFHTAAAFHYAHRYYTKIESGAGNKRRDRRGLIFPGTEEPETWDFLYYSFVVGMTAQVSDVQVSERIMRR